MYLLAIENCKHGWFYKVNTNMSVGTTYDNFDVIVVVKVNELNISH